jgi:LuxR family transcriptional regulator, maltose regulon positive regulatory protein
MALGAARTKLAVPADPDVGTAMLPAHVRPPRSRSGMIERADLTHRLGQSALDNRLTLVSATSGFGKTTVMADVYRDLTARGAHCLWLSVTEADGDLVWLARVLVDQLGRLYRTAPSPNEDFASFANRIVGEAPVVVMIDNWNNIASDSTNRFFDQIALETEGLANFVVASRAIPDFLYETFKLSGQFAEFGARDLSFTEAESTALLVAQSPQLSRDVLHDLVKRTEGWPAGVQLLRLALSQISADMTDVAQFSWTRTGIADYLNKTFFRKLTSKRRAFLCNLAVLDAMSADLAAYVVSDEQADADFRALAHDNVFLNEADDGSEWFQFHSLFRDFLLSEHARESTLPRQEIARRAAAWHVQRDDIERAIPYAIQSGDMAVAVNLLEKYAGDRLVADGKAFLYTAWVEDLQLAGSPLSPLIDRWYRWSLVFSGRWRDAMASASKSVDEPDIMIEAVIAAFSDDQAKLSRAVSEWQANGAPGDQFTAAVMYTGAAIANLARSDIVGASQNMVRARFSADEKGTAFGKVWVLIVSALTELLKGRADEAERLIREATRMTDRMIGQTTPISRIVRSTAAIIAWNRGADETAIDDLERARLSNEEHGLPAIVVRAASVARALELDWNDRHVEMRIASPALRLLEEAYEIDRQTQSGLVIDKILPLHDAFVMRVAVAQEVHPNLKAHGWQLNDLSIAIDARIALLRGDPDTALRILAPAIHDAQRRGCGLSEQRLTLLRVVALDRQNKRSSAMRALIQAADAAVRGGLLQPILAERRLLEPLLPALIEAGNRAPLGDDPEGWRRLVAALGSEKMGAPRRIEAVALIDTDLQVTARETEMLAFLDAGLSNKEIGERLGISIPTVKWHLHNLFFKISVRNRSSAVRYARDKGLI